MIFTAVPGIPGAWSIEVERHADERGWFARTFEVEAFAARDLPVAFAQSSASFNPTAGTLRGLHLQRDPHAEGKLIRCTRGQAFDVMVDVRPGSPGFGRWAGFVLDPEVGRSVYLPPGVAHGFLTLAADTELSYQITAAYVAEAAAGFRWDDPVVAIEWPRPPVLMSDRDRELPPLAELATRSEETR